mgnify:CR=1 FL=1
MRDVRHAVTQLVGAEVVFGGHGWLKPIQNAYEMKAEMKEMTKRYDE